MHALRHSFASQLACEGAPLTAIQALFGHSTIEMTMRYSHLTKSTLRNTVGLLTQAAERDRQASRQPGVNAEERHLVETKAIC